MDNGINLDQLKCICNLLKKSKKIKSYNINLFECNCANIYLDYGNKTTTEIDKYQLRSYNNINDLREFLNNKLITNILLYYHLDE